MNQSTAKKIRREVKKTYGKDLAAFSREFVAEVQKMNLRQRLKLCWRLLKMPKGKAQ